MERVTDIGGVFLKAKDAIALATWYDKHPGFSFGENLYVSFKWVNENNPSIPGNMVFSLFKQESKYFDPSASPFMINFSCKRFKRVNRKIERRRNGDH